MTRNNKETKYPKGSRMWAMEMLERGEKVTNIRWSPRCQHIYLAYGTLFDNYAGINSHDLPFERDGWELYEEVKLEDEK